MATRRGGSPRLTIGDVSIPAQRKGAPENMPGRRGGRYPPSPLGNSWRRHFLASIHRDLDMRFACQMTCTVVIPGIGACSTAAANTN